MMGQVDRGGRRRSIPEAAFPDVHRLRATGMGYQRIAIELERLLGVWTSRGSVERLLKGRGAYQGRRLGTQREAGSNC